MRDVTATDEVRWLREWVVEGRPMYRVGRAGDQLVAEWTGFAELRASRNGVIADFRVAPGADAEHVEKFYRGPVRALLRHTRGELTLHGCCVARRGVAVIGIGESGDGKSTLAHELCRREDVQLVADDSSPLIFERDSIFVAPTEEVCWLNGEALAAAGGPANQTKKLPYAPSSRASAPSRVVAVVKLTFDDSVSEPVLARVEGANAFHVLTKSLFRFVVDEPEVDVYDFERLSWIARAARVYELRRPRDIAMLGRAADMILSLLGRNDSKEST